jgi:hypothetical protein
VVALAAVVPWIGLAAGPAQAEASVDAQGVALARSASCAYGDVDITYQGAGIARQAVTFSAAGGTVLQDRTSDAFRPEFAGVEHVLAEAASAPAPGTVLAVHVVVGADPMTRDTAAEFTVVYRCDGAGNDAGGRNEVLWTCWGDLGACPANADAGLQAAAVPGAVPGAALAPIPPLPAVAATAVTARPSYTG